MVFGNLSLILRYMVTGVIISANPGGKGCNVVITFDSFIFDKFISGLKQNDLTGVRQVVVILLNIARLPHLRVFGSKICQDQTLCTIFIFIFSGTKKIIIF